MGHLPDAGHAAQPLAPEQAGHQCDAMGIVGLVPLGHGEQEEAEGAGA